MSRKCISIIIITYDENYVNKIIHNESLFHQFFLHEVRDHLFAMIDLVDNVNYFLRIVR